MKNIQPPKVIYKEDILRAFPDERDKILEFYDTYKLYNLVEASEYLKISKSSVHLWRRKGWLDKIKMGDSNRDSHYTKKQLDSGLEKRAAALEKQRNAGWRGKGEMFNKKI